MYNHISFLAGSTMWTMLAMANNRQQYIAQNMSHRYLVEVTKVHYNIFSGLMVLKK